MQINTDVDRDEFPNSHPTANELTESEEVLYWSVVQATGKTTVEMAEYYEATNSGQDCESLEAGEQVDQVRKLLTLSELFEEVARRRKSSQEQEVLDEDREVENE